MNHSGKISFYYNIFQESTDHSDTERESDFLKSEVKDFEGNEKDEEDMEEDGDQKDYSESDSDTIRMSSSASETEV